MSDDDLEQFYAADEKKQETIVTAKKPKKSKKRKSEETQENQDNTSSQEHELRKRARYFCASPEQWRCVSKYGEQKMQTWVQDQEFQQKKQFQRSVMDGAHRVLASIVDKVSAGQGHVKDQILADESLRQAIHEEGSEWVSFLNNKIKGAILLAIDVVNGKSEQLRAKPQRDDSAVVRIEEEETPSGSDAANRPEEEETQQETDREIIAMSRPDLR